MTHTGAVSIRKRRKRVLLVTLFAAAAVIGLLLSEVCWRLMPDRWKIDRKILYSQEIGSANDMWRRGDLGAAKHTFKSAIQTDPERYEAYLDFGNLLASEGDTNGALDNYSLALKYCGNTPTNLLSEDEQTRERLRIARKIKSLEKIGDGQ